MDVTTTLLGISIILFLGFFAEFLFKKIRLPDVLILIIIGFIIGPHVLGYVAPEQISGLAPLFTTFALLFLLYDGAFNISIESLVRGAVKTLQVTILNFVISVIIISAIMFIVGFELLTALLIGFILGGISSAFVIPVLKNLKIKGETYSVLMLESALTDVLCIVSAFTVMQLMHVKEFSSTMILAQLISLFAWAAVVGLMAGILWIILVMKVFQEHKSYMITIAYLILLYTITEFFGGNGAIASLFFGLMIKNSKKITEFTAKSFAHGDEKKAKELKERYSINATTPSEEFFYSQISFFLKTFFFVYIGILINISNYQVMLLGVLTAIAMMFARNANALWTKNFSSFDQGLIKAIFARGLAAAAIAQTVIMNDIPNAGIIVEIVFAVIVFSIILSSVKIFLIKTVPKKS